ncbi:hypothetical protein FBEOM_1158 [Fusarium beomiforme]|uniref:Uncharacterized protein n=1 Tax=Fusarium beomiforme TaxID=44412 RepID=A0A9P5AW90_9HYPO|nr:hypothetical protein FBEOM_1158 [Fusarium beomiforme]
MSSGTIQPSDMHLDMEPVEAIIDEQPVRWFTRNCIPPKDPPPGEPSPCTWRCSKCKKDWNISITSRCLTCQSTEKLQSKRDETDTPTSAPRRRSVVRRVYPTIGDFDFEFWAIHNDWRRFRSAYGKNPQKWERRIKRNFDRVSSTQRRVMRSKLEVKTRSQCHTERFEASKKEASRVTNGTLHPTKYGEGGVKLPLCELLPEFDQEIIIPEDVVSER